MIHSKWMKQIKGTLEHVPFTSFLNEIFIYLKWTCGFALGYSFWEEHVIPFLYSFLCWIFSYSEIIRNFYRGRVILGTSSMLMLQWFHRIILLSVLYAVVILDSDPHTRINFIKRLYDKLCTLWVQIISFWKYVWR